MWMACVAAALIGLGACHPMVFLSPDDIAQANSVRVEAQQPESILTLIDKDPQNPSLWYSPAAAFEKSGEVRVYYQRVNKIEKEYVDQRTLCMGIIRDGQWQMPALSKEAPAWGGPNNVVLTRSPYKPTWGGFNVFQLAREKRGYSMIYWDQPGEKGEAGVMLARSRDGLHWQKDPRGTVFTEHNDAFGWLRTPDKYLLYQTALEPWPDKPYPDNLDKFKRIITLRTSSDLITWTPQQPIIRPDAQDRPETEFYLMKPFLYEGRFAAVLFKYYADPAKPGKHSALYGHELVISENGLDWQRPYRNVDIGFWTDAEPFMDAGHLRFVAAQDGALVAPTFRPYGLTAVVAGPEQGEFTTKPLDIPRSGLTVHADVRQGAIEVRAGNETLLAADHSNDAAFHVPAPSRPLRKGARLTVRLKEAKLYAISQ